MGSEKYAIVQINDWLQPAMILLFHIYTILINSFHCALSFFLVLENKFVFLILHNHCFWSSLLRSMNDAIRFPIR